MEDRQDAGASQTRLHSLVTRLLLASELRDALAEKIAAAQRQDAVPAHLASAFSDVECALPTLEAEVLEAALAVIATHRLRDNVQSKDGS